MSETEKIKKESKEEKVRSLIREEIKNAMGEILTKTIIPKGYTRCKVCGAIISQDIDFCPYCERKRKEENTDEDFELFDIENED